MKTHNKTYDISHRLTKPLRRALMLTLFAAFFIISPLVILYTAGYRYEFSTHTIKQTGVLSVDVFPRDSIVTLNGIVIHKNIPIRLPNRAPGTYSLTIERPGYKKWEKDIVIESKNTTYIKDITLIKEALPIRILEDVDHIVAIHGSGYADTLLTLEKNDGIYELNAFNPKNNTTDLIYRVQTEQEPTLEVSPYSSLAYSRIKNETEDILYLIPLTDPENMSHISINEEAELSWNSDNQAEPLYIKEKGALDVFTLSQQRIPVGTVGTSTVWYRDRQGEIWYSNGSLVSNDSGTRTYFFTDHLDSIVDINASRIIGTHKDKTIIAKINNTTTDSIEYINGTSRYYNRLTGEWWVWSPWELTSIYTDGGVSLLNRSGEKIKQVSLLDPHGVIGLIGEQEIAAFNPGYYVRHSILHSDNYTFVSANITDRTIYFLGTVAGKKSLYALEY